MRRFIALILILHSSLFILHSSFFTLQSSIFNLQSQETRESAPATPPAEFCVTGATSFAPPHSLTLWYDQPATATGVSNPWMEYSLPIGNGQLGASLFGGIRRDEIQFNEKTLWTGTPSDMGPYGQYKNFGSVLVEDISGTFGHTPATAAHDYLRYLDIEDGTAGVRYTSPDDHTRYERTYLASHPAQLIAVRYRATGPRRLRLRVSLVPGQDIAHEGQKAKGKGQKAKGKGQKAKGKGQRAKGEGQRAKGDLHIQGQLPTVRYHAHLRVVLPSQGTKAYDPRGGTVTVADADEVVLLLCAATDYDDSPLNPSCSAHLTADEMQRRALCRIDQAQAQGFEAVRARHVADFRSLTGRVSLQLAGAASQRPTDRLVDHYSTLPPEAPDPEARHLERLYFAYGRYLAISSSRGVAVPSNLQGIWNNLSAAPWNSDIHTNINVQMNYWPAEATNLSETHLPLLDFIIKMAQSPNWQRAARRFGHTTEGWTVLTESNIFGGMSTWGSNYLVANAWLASHLWQHYRYTLDRQFLARAFPAMWGCARFWMQRLRPDRGYDSTLQNPTYQGSPYRCPPDGTLVAPDEYSPEQNAHPAEDATPHAQQLIHALLRSVSQACDILGPAAVGLSEGDLDSLRRCLALADRGLHTEPYTAHADLHPAWTTPRHAVRQGDTLLREWKYSPYDVSDDPSHRHLSHLVALYPLGDIHPSSPYFAPAVRSLRLRGDEATGWSMGWKMCLWARALDGRHAHALLRRALRHSTSYAIDQHAGGIYYNLYDAHAPFQIDGNLGATAGVAEMLLQSHTDTLHLLPALPPAWPEGSVSGLRAVGNFTVSLAWARGRLVAATVLSGSGLPCALRCPGVGRSVVRCRGRRVGTQAPDPDTLLFPTQPGEAYEIEVKIED